MMQFRVVQNRMKIAGKVRVRTDAALTDAATRLPLSLEAALALGWDLCWRSFEPAGRFEQVVVVVSDSIILFLSGLFFSSAPCISALRSFICASTRSLMPITQAVAVDMNRERGEFLQTDVNSCYGATAPGK